MLPATQTMALSNNQQNRKQLEKSCASGLSAGCLSSGYRSVCCAMFVRCQRGTIKRPRVATLGLSVGSEVKKDSEFNPRSSS